ncbi:MAG: DUF2183 domain-containing protein [Verrucomicrobiae bacterium]|nr:DUF2183 domain-containing protein [Verrucomicrobiae bacterium]
MNSPSAFSSKANTAGWGLALWLGLGLSLWGAGDSPDLPPPLKADEVVRLQPTAAHLATNAEGAIFWEAPLTVHVFEPEPRELMVGLFLRTLGITEEAYSPEQRRLAAERARGFLVDHQRGKKVRLLLAGQKADLGPTSSEGLATAWIRWPVGNQETVVLPVMVDTNFTAGRSFTGMVHLVNARGWTVISDIDDTIRDSQVLDRHALMQNTFCKPFVPVPGMAALYRQWQTDLGCVFFYVSGSSWALYDPLRDFVRANQFPEGVFELRRVYGDTSALQLLRTPQNYKLNTISTILERWPHRRYILVGDTGERDPEVYGLLARQYPAQVRYIFLRDVTNQPREHERYRKALEGVPPQRWFLFKDPAALPHPKTLAETDP